MLKPIHYSILLTVLLLIPLFLTAQKNVKANLQSAESMQFNKAMNPDLKRVIGNVCFEHDGALLFCDSAHFFEEQNNIEAFGSIRIKISDTLNIYGKHLVYNGNEKTAQLSGEVRMVDKQTTLSTDKLSFDRKTEVASYLSGGNITSKENKLTSIIGHYHTATKQFFFKDKVVLTNPRYKMFSDTLLYHTVSRIAFFHGPSRILSDENLIYCENGWYNTQTDISQFNEHAFLKNKGQLIKGDSLYYDRPAGIGKAFRDVSLIDSVQKITINGQWGYYNKSRGYATVTDSVTAMLFDDKDTLFLHADTLHASFDTNGNSREVSAYYKAKFFRKDLQGMCDSLIYSVLDSTISFYRLPVIWSEDNQLTADSIRLWMTRQQADSMMLYNTALIISLSDTGKFNQIKGRDMTGYFFDNQLIKVNVYGNAKTLYYAREDDGTSIGVNVAAASDMTILLQDKSVKQIKYYSKPDAILFPENDMPPSERLLPGFQWLETRRPTGPGDIFRW